MMDLFVLILIRVSYLLLGMGLVVTLQRKYSINKYKADVLRLRETGKKLTEKGEQVVSMFDKQQLAALAILLVVITCQ